MDFAWSLALVLPAVRAGAGRAGDGHDLSRSSPACCPWRDAAVSNPSFSP
jgi:hypothetical protein